MGVMNAGLCYGSVDRTEKYSIFQLLIVKG